MPNMALSITPQPNIITSINIRFNITELKGGSCLEECYLG